MQKVAIGIIGTVPSSGIGYNFKTSGDLFGVQIDDIFWLLDKSRECLKDSDIGKAVVVWYNPDDQFCHTVSTSTIQALLNPPECQDDCKNKDCDPERCDNCERRPRPDNYEPR